MANKKLSFEALAMMYSVSYYANGVKKDGTRGLLVHIDESLDDAQKKFLRSYKNVELTQAQYRYAPEIVKDVVFLIGGQL